MPNIITKVTRRRGLYHVTIDDHVYMVIQKVIYTERPLYADEEIDMTEYRKWLEPRQFRLALNQAGITLSSRAMSTLQVKNMLLRKGYPDDIIELVILKLKKAYHLDDRQYAEFWIQKRLSQAIGVRRINRELRQKGIARDVINTAFDQLMDRDEYEKNLVETARRYIGGLNPSHTKTQMWRKAMAYLVRHGYEHGDSYHAIVSVINEAESMRDDD